MFTKSWVRIFALAFCALALSGCAALQPRQFYSSVDSLARPDAPTKTRYLLLPGSKGVDPGDLAFQEFATYVERGLASRGFVRASSLDDADVAIFLSYAIGDPQEHQYTYSLPVWGQTGVASANTYGTVSTYGNTGTYSGTTTYTPSYGITGYRTQMSTVTTTTRFLLMDAYDAETYKKTQKMAQVWKTTVVSTGTVNDLRYVFPYMVVAMTPYFAVNTGRKVDVAVAENSPSVARIRNDAPPPK